MDDNTALVLIFAAIFGVDIFNRYFKNKNSVKQQSATKHELEAEIETLKANQAKLIDRIQTLETIVTDDGYELKQQVNQL